ncbi:MAG: Uma2 family endonuclease [Anaerolineae bacterium]|nr:Uma2 family endonuclease [Anaerolineae bacterium]
MVEAIHTRMRADEFLKLPESNLPTELLHGEVIMTPAPELKHQELIFSLAKLIEVLGKEGTVRLSPVDVYLDDENVVQPDVLWTASDSSCRDMDGKYLSGPPELVVEVLSPGTARQDRGEKYALYEKYGAHEYWIVDPAGEFIEVFLNSDAGFARQGLYGPADSFASPVLGGKIVDLTKVFDKQ